MPLELFKKRLDMFLAYFYSKRMDFFPRQFKYEIIIWFLIPILLTLIYRYMIGAIDGCHIKKARPWVDNVPLLPINPFNEEKLN